MNYPNTIQAFKTLPPNRDFGSGGHTDRREQAGCSGSVAEDVRFTPGRHTAADVNPLSFLGAMMGDDYVRQVQPDRPLHTNVVLDSLGEGDGLALARVKRVAANALAFGLFSDLAQTSGSVRMFTMNGAVETSLTGVERASTLFSSGEMLDICRNGLTVVVSDFKATADEFAAAGRLGGDVVGVKLYHPAERRLPGNVGTISLGSGIEVDTNNSRLLASVNSRLEACHQRIVGDLSGVGMSLAEVELTPQVQGNCASMLPQETADAVMAQAVKSLR